MAFLKTYMLQVAENRDYEELNIKYPSLAKNIVTIYDGGDGSGCSGGGGSGNMVASK